MNCPIYKTKSKSLEFRSAICRTAAYSFFINEIIRSKCMFLNQALHISKVFCVVSNNVFLWFENSSNFFYKKCICMKTVSLKIDFAIGCHAFLNKSSLISCKPMIKFLNMSSCLMHQLFPACDNTSTPDPLFVFPYCNIIESVRIHGCWAS